jgi:hypothetical protein
MNNPSDFPPKGFHIERGIDTPYGPMDMLVENEGIRLDLAWAVRASEQPMTFDDTMITPHSEASKKRIEAELEAELRHSRMQRILGYMPPDDAPIDPFRIKGEDVPAEREDIAGSSVEETKD